MDIIKFNEIEDRIIVLRNIPVLLDSDVAYLYGVETREINQAVKNNPRKFPNEGYIFELSKDEKKEVVKIFDNPKIKFSPALPTAFTEKGAYMLATILKGEKAEDTTIGIIETFARMRELSRVVGKVMQEPDKSKQKSLIKRGGELIGDILSNDLEITDSEASIELNLAMLKFKHTTKRSKNTDTQSETKAPQNELDELREELKAIRNLMSELTQQNTLKSFSENSTLLDVSKNKKPRIH